MFQWPTNVIRLTVLVLSLAATAWAQSQELQIRRVSPAGDGVEPAQQIVIQFDRTMVPLGDMARESAALPVSVTPDPGCEWRWLNTSELSCRLPGENRFAPATRYQVTVDTSLTALDGSKLTRPYHSSFETWLPKVNTAYFTRWQGPTSAELVVHLNEPVTAAELTKHIGLYKTHSTQRIELKVSPYQNRRENVIWLPVPEYPGALLRINNPSPNQPLDADKGMLEARRVWQLSTGDTLTAGTEYQLRTSAGLTTPLGKLASKTGQTLTTISTYQPFAFKGVRCIQVETHNTIEIPPNTPLNTAPCKPESINLVFNTPVAKDTLAAITWEPSPLSPAQLTAHWQDYSQGYFGISHSARASTYEAWYPLPLELAPKTEFQLQIPADVLDSFQRPISSSATARFHTGHRTPFLQLPSLSAVLEKNEKTVLPFSFMNLTTFKSTYRTLTASDFSANQNTLDASQQPSVANIFNRPDVAITQDKPTTTFLGVRHWLQQKSGIAWGYHEATPQQFSYPVYFMSQITPYQVFAKVGHFDSLVWVKELATGKPVANAEVTIFHGHQERITPLSRESTTVTTDALGITKLPGAIELSSSWFTPWRDKSQYFAHVKHGEEMAMLPLTWEYQRSIYQASHEDFWSHNRPQYGHMRTWAVTSQGIYRPNSTVKFSVFVRDVGATALQAAPKEQNYTLTITDPKGKQVYLNEDVEFSRFGDIHDELQLAADAPMGDYEIHLSWSSHEGSLKRFAGKFLVTDFVPTTYKVNTLVHGTQFAPGDTVSADISATLHAGGPYTDAETKFTAQLHPRHFSPSAPLAAGFTYGNDLSYTTQTLYEGDGRLDALGKTNLSLTLPTNSAIKYGTISIESQVQSARATWVSDRVQLPYSAIDTFLGLRTDHWVQTANEPFKVEYLAVDLAGNPTTHKPIAIQLERENILRVRSQDGADSYQREDRYEWVTEDSCTAVSQQAPAACELTPTQAGRYRLTGTVKGDNGATQTTTFYTWVTGAGNVVWATNNQGVTLVPDKAEYQPGDTAQVLIQNPYGKTQALVTVERYGVLWEKVIDIDSAAPVIDIPILESFFPGAYLSVAIFSPRVSPPTPADLGKPELALGYQALKVVGQGGSLAVDVSADAPEYQPRDTVNLQVKVQNQQGNASADTRLVALALDQGVLDLLHQGNRYFDPKATFYAPPNGPDMVNYSLVEQLITGLEPKDGKGMTPGGDGDGGNSQGPSIRSNFHYNAYWNAELTTDNNGEATFAFTLPDNLTRWRIFVIALEPENAMGVANTSVQVNLPLQVEPALPNQVHIGDEFNAGFTTTNRSDTPLQAKTQLVAIGDIATGMAHANDQATLNPFQRRLSWLPLIAERAGNIELLATANAGKLRDAVRHQIPVLSPGTEVIAAEYGSTIGAEARIPLQVPANAIADSAQVNVNLTPTLIGGLEGAFNLMRNTWMLTWEMRLSRALSAADYLHLKPYVGETVDWPITAADIQQFLDAAGNYQASNGGMAYLVPRTEYVSPYLSAYTALAFSWMHQLGYVPPAQVEEKLWQYLENNILNSSTHLGEAPILRAAVLAAQAAAPDRSVAKGAIAAMLPERRELQLFGQALLMQAAIDSEDKNSADTLLETLFSYANESAGKISFNERRSDLYSDLLTTPLRANCVILDGFAQYKLAYGDNNALGDTPQKLMRWVVEQRDTHGGWPSTQENIFCTRATSRYADAYEAPIKALQGTVKVADRQQNATFNAPTDKPLTLDTVPLAAAQSSQVAIQHQGQGRLYYGVTLRYLMPPESLAAANAGLTLEREYFVQQGKSWQKITPQTALKRGDIVRVELTIDAPTARHHVLLNDPLPGAFEAINRDLASNTQSQPDGLDGYQLLMFDAGPWPNMSISRGGFYHRDIAFDAVRFYADNLPPGRYRLVYSAQVIAPGSFIAPAPIAKEVYQPDIFGRGSAQRIHVALPER